MVAEHAGHLQGGVLESGMTYMTPAGALCTTITHDNTPILSYYAIQYMSPDILFSFHLCGNHAIDMKTSIEMSITFLSWSSICVMYFSTFHPHRPGGMYQRRLYSHELS